MAWLPWWVLIFFQFTYTFHFLVTFSCNEFFPNQCLLKLHFKMNINIIWGDHCWQFNVFLFWPKRRCEGPQPLRYFISTKDQAATSPHYWIVLFNYCFLWLFLLFCPLAMALHSGRDPYFGLRLASVASFSVWFSDQSKTEEWDSQFWPREKWNESHFSLSLSLSFLVLCS